MRFEKSLSGKDLVSKGLLRTQIKIEGSCKVSSDQLANKSSPDINASKCIIVYFASATLLHERLRENKAQNFENKKSWVKLMSIMSF